MPTESIFANVVISEPEAAERFVAAIEKSQALAKSHPPHVPARMARPMSRDEVKRHFAKLKLKNFNNKQAR